MSRTTQDQVKKIIEYDAKSVPDVLPFIEVANFLVSTHCEPEGASEIELELVERWLSAHFYHLRIMEVASESAGPVSQTNQYKVDLGFQVTRYGQQAIRIDSSGKLKQLDAKLTSSSSAGNIKIPVTAIHLGA